MKIKKTVDLSGEVEIEIGIEDIQSAFSEAFVQGQQGNANGLLYALNHVGTFFRALSDLEIQMLNEAQKKVIREFLEQQAKRFA